MVFYHSNVDPKTNMDVGGPVTLWRMPPWAGSSQYEKANQEAIKEHFPMASLGEGWGLFQFTACNFLCVPKKGGVLTIPFAVCIRMLKGPRM